MVSDILVNAEALQSYCENEGDLAFARNPVFHRRSKHMQIKKYVLTEINPSDILTEPISIKLLLVLGWVHSLACRMTVFLFISFLFIYFTQLLFLATTKECL